MTYHKGCAFLDELRIITTGLLTYVYKVDIFT